MKPTRAELLAEIKRLKLARASLIMWGDIAVTTLLNYTPAFANRFARAIKAAKADKTPVAIQTRRPAPKAPTTPAKRKRAAL